MADVQKTYALVIGAVLVLLGIIGFVQAPILGVFGVNTAQNLLHLVGGAAVLWFGYKGSAKTANMWLGIIAAVVGVLGLIPLAKDLLANWFSINPAITYLHLAVAVISLGIAYGIKEGASAEA